MFQQALDMISKKVLIRPSYDNFIGGKFVAPVEGRYFDNLSPITGAKLCQIALERRRHRCGARRRAQGQGCLGENPGGGAVGDPQQDRRQDGGQP